VKDENDEWSYRVKIPSLHDRAFRLRLDAVCASDKIAYLALSPFDRKEIPSLSFSFSSPKLSLAIGTIDGPGERVQQV